MYKYWLPADKKVNLLFLVSWLWCLCSNGIGNSGSLQIRSSIYLSLLSHFSDYATFRSLLSQKARTSKDSVLNSLDLILRPSGGLPHTHIFSSERTGPLLESMGLSLTTTPPNYTSTYLEYLHSSGYLWSLKSNFNQQFLAINIMCLP